VIVPGGQLGLADNPEKLHTFRLVATLEGKCIEEISCSQGTVFAIAENGDVYNWGITGDQVFSRNYSEADIKTIPIKNSAFKNRKRARQISCGRKHYVLLTIAPYGPTSVPIKGLISASNDDETNDRRFAVESGKLFKFEIQSKDARGCNVDFGGSIFQGLISCLFDEQGSSWKDPNDSKYSVVSIDDNFDGIYSGDCRFYHVGEYMLSLTLDGLHIMGSPFSIMANPGPLHGPCCEVSFNLLTMSGSNIHHSSVNKELPNSMDVCDIIIDPGKSTTVWMKCFDKHRNLNPTVDSTYVFIECKDESENVVYNDCAEVVINSDSISSFEIVSPSERGSYFWRFGVGGMKDSQRIPGTALKSRVITSQVCPSRCEVHVPTRCVAGEEFAVTVILKDKKGRKVKVDTESNSIDLSSTLTPSSEYNICSRAIIQLYQSFGDILTPNEGILQPHEFEHNQALEHITKVAGDATLEVRLEGIIIFSGKVRIEPDDTSPLFVELIGAGSALANWKHAEEERLLMFQCNDKYGNAKGVGGDVVEVKMWREGRQDDELHVVSLTCHDQGNGFHDAHVSVINGDIQCIYVLSVTVNGEEVRYSPFSFNNTYEDHNNVDNIKEVEDMKQEKIAIKKALKEKKKLARIEQENLDKFEKLRKQELTNRRATEALSKEKSKRSRDKEERRLNRMSKRTGGGFIVQFSKDI
jgi:hypothetical protein